MTRRSLTLMLVGSSLVAGGIWLSSAEAPKMPEEQILAVLDAMAQAARDKDLGGILEHVSERFSGQGLDRDGLKGMLFLQLRRSSWTGVMLTEREITLEGATSADVRTKALMAQGASLLPDSADAYDIELVFELEEGEAWRVVRARWRR